MPQRLFTGDRIAAALRSSCACTARRPLRLAVEPLEARHLLAVTVVVNDAFTDGGRTQGADVLDIPWFANEVAAQTPTVLSVGTDYLMPAPALLANNPTVSASVTTQRAIVGLFQTSGAALTTVPQTLANLGDTIELKFDLHLNSGQPLDAGARFRFGLYYTGGPGSISGGDNTNATRNDKGYFGSIGYGLLANEAAILRETGTNNSIIAEGADLTALGATTLGRINDVYSMYTASLTVTKSAANQSTVRMRIFDKYGATVVDLNRVDGAPVTLTFDEIVIVMKGRELDYTTDNVKVTMTTNGGVLPTPPAPTNFAATASGNAARLTWTDPGDAESAYLIERKTGAGGTYAQIAALKGNATSFDDIGLATGTQYFYRVRAEGLFGNSTYAAEKSITTAAALPAGLVLADTFTDGDRASAADPLDTVWYANEATGGTTTLTVSADPDRALTGNTLLANNPAATGTVSRAIVGLFQTSGTPLTTAPQTLANVGDRIQLDLDFRFVNNLPNNINNHFRLGLYYTGGPDIPGSISGGDGTNATRNDKGYLGSFGYGATAGTAGVLREAGNNNSIIAEGADLAMLGDAATSYLAINDNASHHAVFTITRSGASELTIRLEVLNAAGQTEFDFTRVDASPLTFIFDEMIVAMQANELHYRLDNVRVTRSNIGAAVNLGTDRELFLDSHLIGQLTGRAAIMPHEPQLANIAVDYMAVPWEGNWSGGVSVVQDGPLFRMYYFGHPTRTGDGDGVIAMVESTDGINWTRPNLGLFNVNGTTNNNVVMVEGAEPWLVDYVSVIVDTNPAAPAAQKYKMLAGEPVHGLTLFVSPDGIHWSKFQDMPILPPARFIPGVNPARYDSENVIMWSEFEKKYVIYFRTFVQDNTAAQGVMNRWVARTTSTDLVNWTDPVVMEGGQPQENWYFNQTAPYFRAPQIYVAFPAHYIPDPPTQSGHSSRSESRFAFTRPEGIAGDYQYVRPFGTLRWITTGFPPVDYPDQLNWQPYAGRLGVNTVPTGPKEMSVYLEQPGRVVRYALRTDGFASVNAPAGGGELLTKPFKFTGNQLQINYVAKSGGSVRIEIQDANGNPIPGFALADSVALTGDDIDAPVSWKNGFNVASLAGQTIKLRFVMQNANLYSLHFAQTVVAAGWRNPRIPEDVDDNGTVEPLDALTLINELNRGGARALPTPTTPPNAPPPYYDVSGDNQLSPLDALMVINYLNANASAVVSKLNALEVGSMEGDLAGRAALGWYVAYLDGAAVATDVAVGSSDSDLLPPTQSSAEPDAHERLTPNWAVVSSPSAEAVADTHRSDEGLVNATELDASLDDLLVDLALTAIVDSR